MLKMISIFFDVIPPTAKTHFKLSRSLDHFPEG